MFRWRTQKQLTIEPAVCDLFEKIRIAAEVATGKECSWAVLNVSFSKNGSPSLNGVINVTSEEMGVKYGLKVRENEFEFNLDDNSYHVQFVDDIACVAIVRGWDYFARPSGEPMVRYGISAARRWQKPLYGREKVHAEPIRD